MDGIDVVGKTSYIVSARAVTYEKTYSEYIQWLMN